jgi:hypothetical protein
VPGNWQNTFPFSGLSGRYQQVHDAADFQTLGSAFLFTSLNFRIGGTRSVVARQWDVELNFAPTSTSPATMSSAFAANFTATATTVLPFTTINGGAGVGPSATLPNPIQWSLPFKMPFLYIPVQGNLLWEWRHRNTVGTTPTYMDGANISGTPAPAAGVPFGKGCKATGRALPATAQFAVAGGNMSASLIDGASRAPAMMWLGLTKANAPVPGWCTSLYVQPAIAIGGSTDASGTWLAGSTPLQALASPTYFEAYAQFGFLDAWLPAGFGLTDRGTLTGPRHDGRFVSRLWSLMSSGGENATAGSIGQNNGLVTILGG